MFTIANNKNFARPDFDPMRMYARDRPEVGPIGKWSLCVLNWPYLPMTLATKNLVQ
jgi:hypothetical protein